MGLLTNQRRFMGDTGYIIMTSQSNKILMEIMYKYHLSTCEHYMTIYDARNKVNNDSLMKKDINESIFAGTEIETFTEFKYFTNVTEIHSNLFKGCNKLTTIELPKSVKKIDEGAFEECENITSIVLPEGLEYIAANTFNGCKKLTIESMPDTIIDIGEYAFANCISLDFKSLSSNLVSIKEYAFNGCKKLTLPNGVPDTVINIGNNAFENCEKLILGYLSNKLTTINEKVFNGCTNLQLNALPEKLTFVGPHAFDSCINMKLNTLPDKLLNIQEYAFQNCTNAIISNLPDTLKKIGKGAFKDCTSMTADSYPNNYALDKVEPYVFQNCENISISTLPNFVKVIGEYAFSNSGVSLTSFPSNLKIIKKHAFDSCTKIYDIEFSDSIYDIEEGAFKGCENLTTSALPTGNANFTKIQPYTFQGCASLSLSTLPNTIEFIENYAFAQSGVTFNTFSESLKEIAMYAFQDCSSLAELTFPKSLYHIATGAFQRCENLQISALPSNDDYWEIADYVFDGCTNLGLPELKKKIYIIGDYAFRKSGVKISSTSGYLGYIGINAFEGCTSLSETFEISRFFEQNKQYDIHIKKGEYYKAYEVTNIGGLNAVYVEAYDKIIERLNNNKPYDRKYTSGYLLDCDDTFFGTSKGRFTHDGYPAMVKINWADGYQRRAYLMSIYIEAGAFKDCTSLVNVKFGDDGNVSKYRHYISESLFEGCENLHQIRRLPCSDQRSNQGVLGYCEIGANAFSGCTSLAVVEMAAGDDNNGKVFYMSDSIGKIGNNAFKDCTNLIINTWPTYLDSIGDCAFMNACNKVDTGDKYFKNGAFINLFKDNKKLRIIGNNAFENCDKISKINIWDSVTGIGEHAFDGCDNVSNLILSAPIDANNPQPDNLSSVGCGAFYNMSKCFTIDTYIPYNSAHTWITTPGTETGIFIGCGIDRITSGEKELVLHDNARTPEYHPEDSKIYGDENKCWFPLFDNKETAREGIFRLMRAR